MTENNTTLTLFEVPEETTPMMRQYLDIKQEHQDTILFFRLGDFYEMFFQDAETAAKELELTLTGRGKPGSAKRMPMCGIPFHAADNYILRLINKGYKVAICEQVEDPSLTKGLTKREVIKIITPGTLIDEKLLTTTAANYCAVVLKSELKEELYGLAFADISTGSCKLTQIYGYENVQAELARIDAAEVLQNNTTPGFENALSILKKQFTLNEALELQLTENPLAVKALASLLQYFKHTQKTELKQLNQCNFYMPDQYMYLDASSRRNLELVQTLRTQSREGSLAQVLDKTRTAMGSRMLKEWLNYPLLESGPIEERYTAVQELIEDLVSREELNLILKDVYDIERLSGRIANGNANARDLVFLKESLRIISSLQSTLQLFNSSLLKKLTDVNLINCLNEIINMIEKTIVDDPPLQIKDGNIIRPGYNTELDQLRSLISGGKTWLTELENTERQRTGITSLKIGYNNVFGYYLEVTNSKKDLIPADYIRKQTLANAERFITPALKEKEADILKATTHIEKLEYQLFTEVRARVAENIQTIQTIARAVAEIDVLLSFASCAATYRYCRPKITLGTNSLEICGGRHPVIEQALAAGTFIPNDTRFTPDQPFKMLFGPNMSGKSTYMRQTALLVLMAQSGCFVPAASMSFDLVDRLFTRVGAMDDLFSGKSTFMVEMAETANILNNATSRSLIVFDEVGRGTSTYDGMAIAWALTEYVVQKIQAKTIFATHYHELSDMAKTYPQITNWNVSVDDSHGQITFLHKVVPGKASGSYGIHVAKLAGLPEELTSRASDILKTFEP